LRLLGKPPEQKSPITIAILVDLYGTVENHSTDVSFWVACLLAFFGFLRKSTLLPSSDMLNLGKFISRADVIDLTLSAFNLVIRQSKTNQFGQRVLTLPYVSCADARLCPVRALLRHLGMSKLTSSKPLFNYMVSGMEVGFTHAFFVKRLKAGLLKTGHRASDISCHSFRRGGATLGFSIGMSAIDIKLRGDWLSNAYERYVVVSPSENVNSIRALTVGASRIASLK
jgi:integrase